MEKPLVNRVANSGLVTLNLENWYPNEPIEEFDIAQYLFHGLILKEKDFRSALKEMDWSKYEGKVLLVFCSTDAIIPSWAYMLIATYAGPIAKDILQASTKEEYLKTHYREVIQSIDGTQYEDQRIVIKGCGDKDVPVAAYLELTNKLRPYAKSIMFGEPCSTVPVYKKPIKRKS